ncbi:MAG: Uncharacterized protein XD80_0851 [Synergistales bacterium 53_16]|jgi:predicted RNase H-like nuclease (RuvC/YqgF family)|nr:MAG: Uncharacterized protein XD80_0851 [Synergistales bacterium 53_16]KUL01768.1 MAG: Uncharacterized protein XE12_0979 [Synergistales bacterium 54_9]MDK2846183.1 hypothetical protein [Synergistales bacterium]MDN5336017.1 hypothetical protein [Synergistales bacterium]HAG22294.1 hypothetical protein [Synergistaceae bacterium]
MEEHLAGIERLVDELTARMRALKEENRSLKEELETHRELLQENEEAMEAVRDEHQRLLRERDSVIEGLRKEQEETAERLKSLLGKLKNLAGSEEGKNSIGGDDTGRQGELIDRP